MFPADAGRVCFGPALINRSGRLRSLYQLPLGDAVAAAVEDNSRLRSKEVTLPAYFDTAYDGAQPVVPVDATCALVNAIHTGLLITRPNLVIYCKVINVPPKKAISLNL